MRHARAHALLMKGAATSSLRSKRQWQRAGPGWWASNSGRDSLLGTGGVVAQRAAMRQTGLGTRPTADWIAAGRSQHLLHRCGTPGGSRRPATGWPIACSAVPAAPAGSATQRAQRFVERALVRHAPGPPRPAPRLNSAAAGAPRGWRLIGMSRSSVETAAWPAKAISVHGGQQAAVGAVVVGQQLAVGVQRAARCRRSALRSAALSTSGALRADRLVDLGEDRAAEAVLAAAEVDQQQVAVARVGAQLRGERVADVLAPGRRRRRSATAAR